MAYVQVIEAVAGFAEQHFRNKTLLSEHELSFSAWSSQINTAIAVRVKWDPVLRIISAQVAPTKCSLPEREGVETLFASLNRAGNKKYNGYFAPLFEITEFRAVTPVYAAELLVSAVTFKYKHLCRFLADSVYRGGIAGLVFNIGRNFGEIYPPPFVVEFFVQQKMSARLN